jgi:DNA-binding transcriptional regulator YiaG
LTLKDRIVEEYTDTGFGFPVVIQKVPMTRIGNEDVALIDYKKLEQVLVRAMPGKAARLCGAEVRFIRQHFGLTLEEFGKVFGVTHPAVKKWEACGTEPTCMAMGTELALRMWVQRRVSSSSERFMKTWDSVLRHSDSLPRTAAPTVVKYAQVAGR